MTEGGPIRYRKSQSCDGCTEQEVSSPAKSQELGPVKILECKSSLFIDHPLSRINLTVTCVTWVMIVVTRIPLELQRSLAVINVVNLVNMVNVYVIKPIEPIEQRVN